MFHSMERPNALIASRWCPDFAQDAKSFPNRPVNGTSTGRPSCARIYRFRISSMNLIVQYGPSPPESLGW